MKDRVYTILIVSKGSKAPRALQLSGRAILSLLVIVLLSAAGVFALFCSHRVLAAKAERLAALESENKTYKQDMEELNGQLRRLLYQLAELEAFEKEVREIVGSDDRLSSRGSLAGRSSIRPELLQAGNAAALVQYLQHTVPQKAEEMNMLLSEAEQYRAKMAATPDIWPVRGRITSSFGWRKSPFSLRRQFHQGIDIGASSGTTVVAAADGVVKEARYQTGWGNRIVIDHGEYTTYYAHLRKMHVKTGTAVSKGEKIGEVGSTGYSTGPHLHFEIHSRGQAVDPLDFLY